MTAALPAAPWLGGLRPGRGGLATGKLPLPGTETTFGLGETQAPSHGQHHDDSAGPRGLCRSGSESTSNETQAQRRHCQDSDTSESITCLSPVPPRGPFAVAAAVLQAAAVTELGRLEMEPSLGRHWFLIE